MGTSTRGGDISIGTSTRGGDIPIGTSTDSEGTRPISLLLTISLYGPYSKFKT